MKKGLLILVALSIALLIGTSMLIAQEKACASKEKGTCKSEMKLTDEQKTKVEELRASFRLKMIDLKAEREKLGVMLKTEMMKPEPSMQEIEGVIKKLSAVREKTQLAAIEQRLAMRKLLGPDFKGGFSCMEEGRGMMRGRGMTGGGEMDCRMMQKPGMMMGPGHEMPGMRMMMKGKGHSPRGLGDWNHKMFRPFGRNERASMMRGRGMGKGSMKCDMMGGCKMMEKGAMKGGCKMMEKGAMKGGCKMMEKGDMKGGCTMQKGAMKDGCTMGKDAAAGCAKECAGKETECKAEIKEEAKKK